MSFRNLVLVGPSLPLNFPETSLPENSLRPGRKFSRRLQILRISKRTRPQLGDLRGKIIGFSRKYIYLFPYCIQKWIETGFPTRFPQSHTQRYHIYIYLVPMICRIRSQDGSPFSKSCLTSLGCTSLGRKCAAFWRPLARHPFLGFPERLIDRRHERFFTRWLMLV